MATSTPDKRRKSLLATLFFADATASTVHALARDMALVHNQDVSHDVVRGDLTWLREQGLVLYTQDAGLITERGRDVAKGAAPWPGE
jgi:hypothetical protein